MTTDQTQPPAEISSSPCLQGERVVFTGTLASMTHKEAHQLVEQHGGTWSQNVSQQTTILVIGEEGWPLDPDGQPSQKLQQVNTWREEGHGIRLVNESDWLRLLGLEVHRQEIHKLYTPAMLSQLLDIPVNLIRKWERQGLLKPVKRVFKLPYFNYQEVTTIRRLSELLNSGISRAEIERGLLKLQAIVGSVDRSLAQLELLVQSSHLLYRDKSGLIEPSTGQRHFDFEPATEKTDDDELTESLPIPTVETQTAENLSAADWYRQGCQLLEEGELTAAVEALRCSLMRQPFNAEAHFCLAEAHYRNGNKPAALERYYMAVEVEHNYLEAWTQLGCIHEEQGELQAAADAFQIALEIHPHYPDAHLHRAEVLHQLNRTPEAVEHWRTYLQYDDRGPWAIKARQRLAEFDKNK